MFKNHKRHSNKHHFIQKLTRVAVTFFQYVHLFHPSANKVYCNECLMINHQINTHIQWSLSSHFLFNTLDDTFQ